MLNNFKSELELIDKETSKSKYDVLTDIVKSIEKAQNKNGALLSEKEEQFEILVLCRQYMSTYMHTSYKRWQAKELSLKKFMIAMSYVTESPSKETLDLVYA